MPPSRNDCLESTASARAAEQPIAPDRLGRVGTPAPPELPPAAIDDRPDGPVAGQLGERSARGLEPRSSAPVAAVWDVLIDWAGQSRWIPLTTVSVDQ